MLNTSADLEECEEFIAIIEFGYCSSAETFTNTKPAVDINEM